MIWAFIPVYNEESALHRLFEKIKTGLKGYEYTIVVVDDGSFDQTSEILKEAARDYPLQVITHPINRGLGETERDGFEYIAAHCQKDDVIVRVEGDNTHEPAYILNLIQKLDEGYDVVNTSRFRPGGGQKGLDFHRSFISRCANYFMQLMFNVKGVRDYSCGFRAYRAGIIQDAVAIFGNNLIQLKGVGFTSTLEILVKLKIMGCSFAEVPFVLRYDQKQGKSKMVGSVTTIGYLLLALFYNWPFGGWKHTYRKLAPLYKEDAAKAVSLYETNKKPQTFLTRINSQEKNMCGICGILHFDPDQSVDLHTLTSMSETMLHRGPDDFGIHTAGSIGLAHRRLSIIDLTSTGHQPMNSMDGRYWIIYNGEIYNYIELKRYLIAKGYSFQSKSDTEVLLNLFIEEGKDCLQKLNGMFAFAIWDSVEKKLFMARDRLGIKPFYWYHGNGTFLFASEIKALFRYPGLKAKVNLDGLQDYLSFQFCLGEKTMFKDVHSLSPGSWMEISQDGTIQTRCYWELNFQVDTTHSEEYFRQTLSDLLDDSIKLRLRSDVPLGSHLSGGLDSSVVASLAASHMDQSVHTFSGGFREGIQFDETKYARILAEHNHTIHHEIFPCAQDFVDLLPSIIYHMDEPATGPGIFPQLMVSKMAKENVTVVLGGQGGDELFAGYVRYLIAYLEECIRGGIEGTQENPGYIVNFQSILPNLPQLHGYQSLMRHFWKDGLFDPQEERYFRLIDRGNSIRVFFNMDFMQTNAYSSFEEYRQIFTSNAPASYINKMTRFDIKTLLPALLHVEDRTSMMVSLESRVPLLDHRIVELSAAIPPRYKYAGGQSKHILRQASSSIVPKQILERQDKMGFPVPLNIWYREEPVRSFVCETLLSSSAVQRGWFDRSAVQDALDQELPFGRTIWGLLCLELWAKTFLD